MSESQFIELALRYLDKAADADEVGQLGAEMLENPSRRAIYRDLVRQAQLAHEWNSSEAVPSPKTAPRNIRILATTAAAAAAIILAALFVFRPSPSQPNGETADLGESKESMFAGEPPSWSDIYPSLFDYPDFVWHSELRADRDSVGSIDDFDSGSPLSATPTAVFHRLLAPIALFPSGDTPASVGLY